MGAIQTAASLGGVVSSTILILEFRRVRRVSQPSFWLEPVRGGAGRDPVSCELVAINCGGSDCYRVTAEVSGGGVSEIVDRFRPRDSATFNVAIPSTTGARTSEVVLRGLRPDGTNVSRHFSVTVGGSNTPVECIPLRWRGRAVRYVRGRNSE